jgi:predicted ribosomally synthesized peptide with SipW-like signal peptide
MKKSRFLALVLVASLSLVGAGYAYWTDTLFVNSTVNTGKFEVEFTKVSTGLVDHGVKTADNYTNLNTPIAELTDSNTTTIKIVNLYPGKEVTYEITAANTGTIPVVFDKATVGFVGDTTYLMAVLQAKCGLSFGGPKFGAMDKLQAQINKELDGLRIEPGKTAAIKGAFILPTTVENGDLAEEQDLSVNITVNWKQHNKPVD